MKKYLVEIALNKEGVSHTEIVEVQTPCTGAELEKRERAMFDYLKGLWVNYRKNASERNLLCACSFEDWQREMNHYRFTNTICWSCDRDMSKAHITIFNL